jgi:RimJ/RimL family protein N-acetyltransferase
LVTVLMRADLFRASRNRRLAGSEHHRVPVDVLPGESAQRARLPNMVLSPRSDGAAETERLLLLPWTSEYDATFAELCRDGDAMRFISGGRPLEDDIIELIIGRTRAMWAEYGYGPWAAIEKETGRWVGRIGLNLMPDWPGPDKWEVGFELAPGFWGRGLATEATGEAIRFAWANTPLPRIISATAVGHRASRNVMEKCGLTFQEEINFRGVKVAWYAIDRPTVIE